MGMNQIPPHDKEAVVNSLAEGRSYSDAMNGTSIKSKDTIHRIAKSESNAIERKRAQYLKKIKKLGANDNKRAEMWARMIYATKKIGKEATETPDWQARATALKYIDSLSEIHKEDSTSVVVNNNVDVASHNISEDEKNDFNSAFRKFLMQE